MRNVRRKPLDQFLFIIFPCLAVLVLLTVMFANSREEGIDPKKIGKALGQDPATPAVKTAPEVYREADYLVRLEIKATNLLTGKDENGQMSGFFVKLNNKLLLLTAAHINQPVYKINEIKAVIKGQPGGYSAEIDKMNNNLDCAVLKITDKGFDFAGRLANIALDKKFQPGDTVYSLGSPAQTEFAVGKGIIMSLDFGSARNPFFTWQSTIVHAATIAPGSSGGPLLDESGQVIGMNVGVAEQYTTLGYAIYMHDILTWLIRNY